MYDNYIFDLYGTLADIRTNENKPYLWQKMSDFYTYLGAPYSSAQLRREFRRLEQEAVQRMQKEAESSGSQGVLIEPDLTGVFQRLFQEKGVSCERQTARMAAIFFRTLSRQLLRVYDGVKETLQELRSRGKGNKLTSLNLFGVVNLTNLNIDDNQITTMIVSGLPSLSTFVCSDNNMTTLGVRDCKNLLDLVCSYNDLTTLDVSNCPNILYVDCSYNDLTQLNLSNQTFLQRLICNNNQLQMLDVSFDDALVYINCRYNQITDFRNVATPNLRMIACQWNY